MRKKKLFSSGSRGSVVLVSGYIDRNTVWKASGIPLAPLFKALARHKVVLPKACELFFFLKPFLSLINVPTSRWAENGKNQANSNQLEWSGKAGRRRLSTRWNRRQTMMHYSINIKYCSHSQQGWFRFMELWLVLLALRQTCWTKYTQHLTLDAATPSSQVESAQCATRKHVFKVFWNTSSLKSLQS